MTFEQFLGLAEAVTGLDLSEASPGDGLDTRIDSLGLVLLLLDAEEHGVPVPDELVAAWETLGDVHDQFDRWYASETPGDRGSTPSGGRSDRLAVLQTERARVSTVPIVPEHVPWLHDLASRGRNAFAWWPRGRSVSLAEFEDRLWHDAVLQEVVVDRLMALGPDEERTRFLEGVGLVVARAFTMWPLRKLYLLVPTYNDLLLAPRRELLVEEGRLVGHEYFDGEFHDVRLYALYRERFAAHWS